MANASAPPTQGTTDQPASPENLIWSLVKAAAPRGSPDDSVIQQIQKLVVRSLADMERQTLRQTRAVLDLADRALPTLPPPVQAIARHTAQKIAQAAQEGKAVANADGDSPVRNVGAGADPVDLATAQLVHKHTDLRPECAGVTFELCPAYLRP